MKIYPEVEQGSDEWFELRRGILTASEMKLIITPTLKIAANDKCRSHVNEIAAQRVTQYVEPHYVGDDMLRGHRDEVFAANLYSEKYAATASVGFITEDKWGFKIGYSPDRLVGEDGLIECKSRRQKYQFETICDKEVPQEHVIQCQTGLLVTGRKWLDYVSYCGGMPMIPIRVFADPIIQTAILKAAEIFEQQVTERIAIYHKNSVNLFPTERVVEEEMEISNVDS